MKSLIAWIILALCTLACLSWITSGVRDELREDSVFADIIRQRDKIARSTGTITLGAAGSWETSPDVLAGIRQGLAEINREGGILGRAVELSVLDDHGSVDGALEVAQTFSANPNIGIVIGHTAVTLNLAVAQNYGFYHVLCISPSATLTGSGHYAMQFSNGLAPRQLSELLMDLAVDQRWHRIGLIYDRTGTSRHQARLFESLANSKLKEVPLSVLYEGQDLTADLEHWKRELGLDAFVLSLSQEDTATVMQAIRAAGMTLPLVSTRATLPREVQMTLQGPCYLLNATKEATVTRLAATAPESGFALGYETVMLLKRAAQEAGSAQPAKVAEALAELRLEKPLVSTIRFDRAGNALKTGLAFTRLRRGL